MPITTQAQEYQRLRSYLNPAIAGPTTDAILNALAAGASSYLVNNLRAINDSLYIATASGTYLDQRLAEVGVTRPAAVGLSDDVFRQIGIQVKNRKQVRDLMNNLLDAIFGDEFVKATNACTAIEPYNLANNDNLLVNFDEKFTANIIFNTDEFENIATATAQEVADAISTFLSSNGFTGSAIVKNNGLGNYVELISSTIGPASSITVLGGSAQNELIFPSPIAAGGNASTQWTLSLQPGGIVRFTWTGGSNPNLGLVSIGYYVNIFGGGFSSSSNIGTYTITNAVGGSVNNSYFEVSNPLGTSGIVTQGSDSALLFYNPIKYNLSSNSSYAAIYQVQSATLQIFLPAATQVVRRSRVGSAHIHYPPYGTFTLNANPSPGDTFSITSTVTYTAGTDFAIGISTNDTVQNLANTINAGISGLIASPQDNVLLIQSDNISITLTIVYTGSQNIIASGPQGDNTSLEPNQQGPYGYDLSQGFTVGSVNSTLTQAVTPASSKIIHVADASAFPNSFGYLMLDYGSENQEGPISYLATPSGTTLLISPSYNIQETHLAGASVNLIPLKAPVQLTSNGTDYPFYVTDVVSGRTYAQQLLQSVAAVGINVVFTILYPNSYGLGKWGTPYDENPYVWGDGNII